MTSLATPHETNGFDWVLTNPPFRRGEDFTLLALKLARRGVAMLTRTVFIESVGECLALLGLTLLQRRQACGPAGIPEPGLADRLGGGCSRSDGLAGIPRRRA